MKASHIKTILTTPVAVPPPRESSTLAEKMRQPNTSLTDSEILTGVRTVIAEVANLPIEKIEIDRDLFELGFDSLSAIEVFCALERKYGVKLDIEDVFLMPTTAALSDALKKRLRQEHG